MSFHYVVTSNNHECYRNSGFREAILECYTQLQNQPEKKLHFYIKSSDFVISEFSVKFRQTLILENATEKITPSQFYPEFLACDAALIHKVVPGQNISTGLVINPSVRIRRAGCTPYRKGNLLRDESRDVGLLSCHSDISCPHPNPITTDTETIIDMVVKNKSQPKLSVFASDKKSYQKIRDDILAGKMSEQKINPDFVLKYDLFRILEKKSAINFDTDSDIESEFHLFTDFMTNCDSESETENENAATQVYLPHNWDYMSLEQKQQYADNYSMTINELELRAGQNAVDDTSLFSKAEQAQSDLECCDNA